MAFLGSCLRAMGAGLARQYTHNHAQQSWVDGLHAICLEVPSVNRQHRVQVRVAAHGPSGVDCQYLAMFLGESTGVRPLLSSSSSYSHFSSFENCKIPWVYWGSGIAGPDSLLLVGSHECSAQYCGDFQGLSLQGF